MPLTVNNKNEIDSNYEHMIENLLLQQVLLYTHEQCFPTRARSQSRKRQRHYSANEHLVIKSSSSKRSLQEEPTLCLIESSRDNPSYLIERMIRDYSQNREQYTRFDQNLIDILINRSEDRQRTSSVCPKTGNYYRLQWLAIGLVIDRLFFYAYFSATLISYFVTLWLIPFTHPNLTIDIQSL